MKRDLPPELDIQALYFRLIKRLGRNARPDSDGVLDAAAAGALWSALLQQQFTASQEAALLMGLRVHGESAGMLAAFVAASRPHVQTIAARARPVVVLYCLGATRKRPNLAPLIAIELARTGVPALMITAPSAAPGSADVMARLGFAPARDAEQAAQRLAADHLAWIQLETVAPPLARLIARRGELAFRNSAHTMIKLLSPLTKPSILIAHYTHAAYRERLAEAIGMLRASALLVRGTEGDPVAWAGDNHAPLAWCNGRLIELPAESRSSYARPEFAPAGDSVTASATFIEQVLTGAQPCPAPITAQVQHLSLIAARMQTEAA